MAQCFYPEVLEHKWHFWLWNRWLQTADLHFLVLVWLTKLLPIWLSAEHRGAWQLFLHTGNGIYYIACEVEWVFGSHTGIFGKAGGGRPSEGRERAHGVSRVSCCAPDQACLFQSTAKVFRWGQTKCNEGFSPVIWGALQQTCKKPSPVFFVYKTRN